MVVFSKDSDGGFNALFYSSNDEKGDIVIDCSYSKFFFRNGISRARLLLRNIKCKIVVKMVLNLGHFKLYLFQIIILNGPFF